MKKLFVLCTLILTNMSHANTYSKREKLIVDTLTSAQVQTAIQQYSINSDYTENIKIEEYTDLDVLTLEGTKLLGGDVVCGTTTLKISRSFEFASIGMGMQPVFKTDLSKTGCANK